MTVTNYLGPEAIAQYDLRSRQTNLAFNRGTSNLTTQKEYSTQDFGLKNAEAQRGYGFNYRALASPFARRGILNSGMMKAARENQQMNYQQSLADMQRMYNRQMGGYNTTQGDMEMIRNFSQEQIIAERNAANSALAAQLRGAQ